MMAPAVYGAGMPRALPMPIKAIPMVAMVVQEVPVMMEMMLEMMQAQGRKKRGDMICTP